LAGCGWAPRSGSLIIGMRRSKTFARNSALRLEQSGKFGVTREIRCGFRARKGCTFWSRFQGIAVAMP